MKNINEYKGRLHAAITKGWVSDYSLEVEEREFVPSIAVDAVIEVIREILIEVPVVRPMPDPELRRIFEVYKPPFKYSDDFQAIVDAKDDIVTTHIRGWAFLQKLPDGIQIQDNIGKLIAELLNKEYERIKAR